MSMKMTAAEREAFLADLHVGVLSIAREGRAPLSAPIWYDYEPGGEPRKFGYLTTRIMTIWQHVFLNFCRMC